MSVEKRTVIFHPFVAAIFPPLSLYLHNVGKLYFADVLRPLVLAFLSAAVLWWLAWRLIKDVAKSALVTTIFSLLFFSFGHLPLLLENGLRGIWPALVLDSTAALTVLLAIWFGLWLLVSMLTVHATLDFKIVTQFLNVFAVTLILTLGYRYGQFVHYRNTLRREAGTVAGFAPVAVNTAAEALPDIYYIVVDGFGREDVLRDLYALDNTEFLTFLEDQGFYIATESNANYNITLLSLASTLNFEYLDTVAAQVAPDSENPLPVFNLIQHSRLLSYYQTQGYTLVNFASGYAVTELSDADVMLAPQSSFSAFEDALINTTPLRVFLLRKQYDYHRDKILYTLNHLSDAAQLEGPVFVFAHIVAPHPPYVLDADGRPLYPDMQFVLDDGNALTKRLNRAAYIEGYRGQVQFLAQALQETLAQILARSEMPPIIIVQADHGPGAYLNWESLADSNIQERFGILNAYYFPGQDYTALYPAISPVNTFRVVLNQYFGADYPLLADRHFFALMRQPYRFLDVSEHLNAYP